MNSYKTLRAFDADYAVLHLKRSVKHAFVVEHS